MTLENSLNDLKEIHMQTYKHSVRCGNYLAMLAKACGKDEKTIQTYREAGYAHDMGKRAVMKHIKSTVNFREMKSEDAAKFKKNISMHVMYAASYLKDLKDYKKEYLDAANYHHCFYNNQNCGYSAETVKGARDIPPTKSGIPEVAQMLAVVDVYDALTDPERKYRQGAFPEEKVNKIMSEAMDNGQFNPRFYKVFTQEIVPQIKNMTEEEKLKTKFTHKKPEEKMRSNFAVNKSAYKASNMINRGVSSEFSHLKEGGYHASKEIRRTSAFHM